MFFISFILYLVFRVAFLKNVKNAVLTLIAGSEISFFYAMLSIACCPSISLLTAADFLNRMRLLPGSRQSGVDKCMLCSFGVINQLSSYYD
jgi:hypothetical protein